MKLRPYKTTEGRNPARGVALLVVLMLVAIASVVGLSYLYSATLMTAGTENLLHSRQADYVAAGGLEHALYVLQTMGSRAEGTTWGPYALGDEDGSYSFEISVADEQATDLFHISSTGTSGELERIRIAGALVRSTGHIELEHALRVDREGTSVPGSAELAGDVYGDGNVFVRGTVLGDVYATGSAWRSWFGSVGGSLISNASRLPVLSVSYEDYIDYAWHEDPYQDTPDIRGQAIERIGNTVSADDAVCNGGAITSSNPGGVVHLVPASVGGVSIGDDVSFQGTLVTEGDIELSGRKIELQALDGFPAVVAGGRVIIHAHATADIEGMVIADGGIVRGNTDGNHSRMEITGGILSERVGIDYSLLGSHTVKYDADRCRIYDFGNRWTLIVEAD